MFAVYAFFERKKKDLSLISSSDCISDIYVVDFERPIFHLSATL